MIALAILGVVVLAALIGVVAFSYAGRPSRVTAARNEGLQEDEIQREVAMLRRIRSLFLAALVIACLAAVALVLLEK
jgi:hypothetical protein